eukprot:CAMPEP_0171983996 /NCGR_PEP_ID=MMETSP0993-20121228/273596_1 /TAXON_ID=483369 /ORGANISM="non described non described, Strain CCMP2098" /LENGTH=736 /DNA_ID=CAMNT_0012636795 /DNA_START=50 /DNA_END=2261 /DNA_ORIENTATION=-
MLQLDAAPIENNQSKHTFLKRRDGVPGAKYRKQGAPKDLPPLPQNNGLKGFNKGMTFAEKKGKKGTAAPKVSRTGHLQPPGGKTTLDLFSQSQPQALPDTSKLERERRLEPLRSGDDKLSGGSGGRGRRFGTDVSDHDHVDDRKDHSHGHARHSGAAAADRRDDGHRPPRRDDECGPSHGSGGGGSGHADDRKQRQQDRRHAGYEDDNDGHRRGYDNNDHDDGRRGQNDRSDGGGVSSYGLQKGSNQNYGGGGQDEEGEEPKKHVFGQRSGNGSSNSFANGANQNVGNVVTAVPAPAFTEGEEPKKHVFGQRSGNGSSNSFANGANQNVGNVVTGRSSTRIHAPPGGVSSFSLSHAGQNNAGPIQEEKRPSPQRRHYHHDQQQQDSGHNSRGKDRGHKNESSPRQGNGGDVMPRLHENGRHEESRRPGHQQQQQQRHNNGNRGGSAGGGNDDDRGNARLPALGKQKAGGGSGVSSNLFANGANQNVGNVVTGRSSTRIHAPPGGVSSLSLRDDGGHGGGGGGGGRVGAVDARAVSNRNADDNFSGDKNSGRGIHALKANGSIPPLQVTHDSNGGSNGGRGQQRQQPKGDEDKGSLAAPRGPRGGDYHEHGNSSQRDDRHGRSSPPPPRRGQGGNGQGPASSASSPNSDGSGGNFVVRRRAGEEGGGGGGEQRGGRHRYEENDGDGGGSGDYDDRNSRRKGGPKSSHNGHKQGGASCAIPGLEGHYNDRQKAQLGMA